jgi:hypothetical protein
LGLRHKGMVGTSQESAREFKEMVIKGKERDSNKESIDINSRSCLSETRAGIN